VAAEEKESKAKKKEELIERVDAMKAADAETKETDTQFGEDTEATGNVTDPTPGWPGEDQEVSVVPAEGETAEVIPVGAWVQLGFGESIPEEVQGHFATVTDAPKRLVTDGELSPRPYYERVPDVPITVQTRDQFSMILQIEPDEEGTIISIDAKGRSGVLPIG
jgi:hypothetical protein